MKPFFFAPLLLMAPIMLVGCGKPSVPTTANDSDSETGIAVGTTDSTESPNATTAVVVPAGPATEPMAGYTLFSPLRSKQTYLVNLNKEVVHSWTTSDNPPGNSAYLMENGDLVRGARDPDFRAFRGGGIGAIVQRFNWDGEMTWDFRYANDEHCAHHDIAMLPNGNMLMIAWESVTKEEAIAQGRDPDLLSGNVLWPDHVIEVKPTGDSGGEIVWEWHVWDHIVQDFDRELPNFGVIYEHPELIDVNNTGSTPPASAEELSKLRSIGYTGGGDDGGGRNRRGRSDWLHTNGIDYNPELDQIILSAKNFSEVWIIDHSTTTEQAASHRGGNSGKGGDLLYRWGNPWAYKSGTIEDKKLFDQHNLQWIPNGLPGAGNIICFNNGPGRDYSSITEISPPINADGDYVLNDTGTYGPEDLTWEYTAENKKDFYASFISGTSRLANGNTLICDGVAGRIFEVNTDGKTLWDFTQPFGGELDSNGRDSNLAEEAKGLVEGSGGRRNIVNNNGLFRANRYSASYPGLAGRTLEPLADQPVPFSKLVEQAADKLRAENESDDGETSESETAEPATAGSENQ